MNEKLKQKIAEKKVSHYRIAKEFGTSQTAISYKVNHKDISKEYNELKKFAEILDCEIEDILDE